MIGPAGCALGQWFVDKSLRRPGIGAELLASVWGREVALGRGVGHHQSVTHKQLIGGGVFPTHPSGVLWRIAGKLMKQEQKQFEFAIEVFVRDTAL
jgi:hypothetical protein